ncbi:MAG: valine--tRNA ligase [Solirubrobacteraceae bacterium]|nr:valine--tRNA ligase [Solirubrobacteraceae bacterium]
MSAPDLSTRTRYEPSEVEPEIQRRWLESGAFEPGPPTGDGQATYSIAIPPPNVTGVLHMGHALNGSIQDSLIRLNRMRGKRTKWILGTDHAGIATQTQVEKKLAREGTSRHELGREAFTVETQAWRKEYGGKIVEQFKRIGASADYSDERFTMDDGYVRAVQKVFIDLYEQGLIYRDHYMVNWDPGSGSAISDLEVEEKEGVEDTLFSIAYPFADGDGEIVVATVRPETMFGDVAVAVNPDDERYADAIGRKVVLPLSGGKEIPVIADDHVKVDFGSGALKITPGHDPNDFEIGRRHNLPAPSAIGEDGRLTALCGEFAGQTAEEARSTVTDALRASGALRGEEAYVHTVPFSQRSGARIEPLISLQWFMNMDPLAGPAIDAVSDGRVRIHPPVQQRRYLDWLGEIRPWCVSRQLWWGHQLPVYYRGGTDNPQKEEAEETYVGLEPPQGEGWVRDEDVLDTWFSSALWPFATLGWPEQSQDLADFYPTDVLSTARDILFLWVARMVMLGLRFADDVPFRDVYVHSVIQAPDGRRMSKSLGTGIDPLDVIEGGERPPVFKQGGEFPAYGADAVRFGLLAISTTQDVRFSEDKVQQGQQLANKLFNATRFVLLQLEELGLTDEAATAPAPRTDADRWILSRLERVTRATADALDGFEFAKAALGLYDFVYGELCDWYVELAKPRLRGGTDEEQRDLAATLLYAIDRTLRLAHPVIPFVTEELWSHLPGDRGLLVTAAWPAEDDSAIDEAAETRIDQLIDAVTAVRGWRERVGVKPSAILPARLREPLGEEREASLQALARIDLSAGEGTPVATVTTAGAVVDLLPDENIDLEAAEQRLAARRGELESEIKRVEGKLSNAKFVERAPVNVVQVERDKLAALKEQLAAL